MERGCTRAGCPGRRRRRRLSASAVVVSGGGCRAALALISPPPAGWAAFWLFYQKRPKLGSRARILQSARDLVGFQPTSGVFAAYPPRGGAWRRCFSGVVLSAAGPARLGSSSDDSVRDGAGRRRFSRTHRRGLAPRPPAGVGLAARPDGAAYARCDIVVGLGRAKDAAGSLPADGVIISGIAIARACPPFRLCLPALEGASGPRPPASECRKPCGGSLSFRVVSMGHWRSGLPLFLGSGSLPRRPLSGALGLCPLSGASAGSYRPPSRSFL